MKQPWMPRELSAMMLRGRLVPVHASMLWQTRPHVRSLVLSGTELSGCTMRPGKRRLPTKPIVRLSGKPSKLCSVCWIMSTAPSQSHSRQEHHVPPLTFDAKKAATETKKTALLEEDEEGTPEQEDATT